MRKFTFFLSLIVAFVTATAQEVTVTSLDQLSNDKTYFIESARGFLMNNTTANAGGISTSTAKNLGTTSVSKNWNDADQQFKIEAIDGSHYLYSVGAGKYVAKDGSWSDTAVDALEITPSSNSTYNWKLCIGGNGMNSQEANQMDAGIVVNSWTDEDPGNRYKIIDTEASTVVVVDYPNEFAEFDQNKCYIASTTSRGGWAVKDDKFCSTVDAGLGDTSNPEDVNQHFAILSVDGENYYLYSVGAQKFVNADKSLVAGVGEAIELADASKMGDCRVRVNFKGYADRFINLGGSKQMIIDSWSDVDAGNAIAFIEAGEFDPTAALAMLNPTPAPEPVVPVLNETVVFDFANSSWGIPTMEQNNYSSIKTAGEYTDGVNTIHIDPTANKGSYIYDSKGFLNLGKPGSKITLPAFGFAVEKIEVVGHPSATNFPNVDMNVYVGKTAVSTACVGSTATSTFEIAADNQAAGNIYELVIGSNGGNSSSYAYITYIKVYPAENKLEAPVIDLASGVYVGKQTVNVHSATADLEGVTYVTYYYTTDGNEPTVEDEETDGEITITESCTLKVIVELTYGDKTYVSASSSAEYIISEEVTYHRATSVESGSYFIVADGNVAAPIEGTTLPAVEAAIDGNNVTSAVYYALTLEEADGGFHIKDINGNYIYTTMMTPHKLSSGTYAPTDVWTIEITANDNSSAIIVCNDYALVFHNGVFCTCPVAEIPTEAVLPTLYGTQATGIENVIGENGEVKAIYDLTGRRIDTITNRGIYIVGGKKVLVK